MSKVDKVTKEKRVYEISRMLRTEPISYIREYMAKKWGISQTQAYRYIDLARKEWQKHFNNVKRAGMGYHVAQFRDLKKKAELSGDIRLQFDIAKEEAKILGSYPAEKHKLDLPENFEITVNLPKGEKGEDDNN
jgi:hypothetical protein